MKYLSFVVPSYNASKYLDKVIPSLLVGGDDVEIIVVNDGSKDNTLEIAKRYEELYPNIVKAIDKENGGHGSTINKALEIATGLYFKCVDADDWLEENALKTLLAKIKYHYEKNTLPDLYLTNFVYEHVEEGISNVSSLRKYMPKDESIFGWKDIKKFNAVDFFMMHSFVYKLDVLKKSKLHLLEHTFYVDNIFVYQPLYFVNTICFLDIDLYRYFIGRADQSVSKTSINKNYMHQLRCFEYVMNLYSEDDFKKLTKKHRYFMIRTFANIYGLTQYYVTFGDYKEKYAKYKEIEKRFKAENKSLYKTLTRKTIFAFYHFAPFFIKKIIIKGSESIINKRTGWLQ